MGIGYDPTKESLFHPERRETAFVQGESYNSRQVAVEAARLAYYKAETGDAERKRLVDALNLAGYSRVEPFTSRIGTQAFAAYDENKRAALVSFRGTQPDSFPDVLIDLLALPILPANVTGALFGAFFGKRLESLGIRADDEPVPGPGKGRVHAGFLAAFKAVAGDIEKWLEKEASGRQTLTVCGHSLGAALATIAASAWRTRLAATHLVTLGSPRVGDGEFVKSIDGIETHRIVDCCDVVTRVPPPGIYEHTRGLVFIRRDGTPAQDPPAEAIEAERKTARREYRVPVERLLIDAPARDLADHAPINYLRAFFS